jgi:hypothetical protein
MSKNEDQLATLNARLPDSVRENLSNATPSNTEKPDQRVAFNVGEAAQNTENAVGQFLQGSSLFVGYTAGNGPVKNHGNFGLFPVNGNPPISYSTKPFKLGKLANPVLGVGGVKFSIAVVGTVNSKTGAQEGGLSLTGIIPTPIGKAMVFINFRATTVGDLTAAQNDRSGKKITFSANFGAGLSASDVAANLSGVAVAAGISTVPGLQFLGANIGRAFTAAVQGGLDAANANAWVGVANRASVTFQNGQIVSIKIGDFEVPFEKIGEFAVKAYEEGKKLAAGINDQLNKAGITIFNDDPTITSVGDDRGLGTPSRTPRQTLQQPDYKPQAPIVSRLPERTELGKNRGGPLTSLNYNDLVKNQNNVATDLITYIYKNDVVNGTRNGGKWDGTWTAPTTIDGRPGEEWQMRLSPSDKNVLDMRFTAGGKTYGYSAHLGADGRFKVEGDPKLRDLPPYLEDRVRGIKPDQNTTQNSEANQKPPKVQRITASDAAMISDARKDKSSDVAYVVRGLDSVILAPKENPAFAKQLQGIMKKSGDSITDDKNGIRTTFTNVGGFLEVAVSREGGPITFKNVSYDRGNGKFSWNVVGLDKVEKKEQEQSSVTIYGRDKDLVASAVKLGQGSNAGLAVYALNNAAASPKNSPFAQQIKETMTNGARPISEKFTDSQGRSVDVEWSKYGNKLQVKVEREGVLPTIHRVSYDPKSGNVGWVVTDINPPKRKPVELGSENTVLSKIGDPKSREANIVGLIDRLYVNTAKPELQGNRAILKNLSTKGYFLDEKGNVKFSFTYKHNGDTVSLTGGKGVIAVTVTPADSKASPYIFRTGIDADGRPMLKGSAQRMSQYLTSDNSSLDLAKPEQVAALTSDRQMVTNLNNTKQLAMVTNATTGKVDIVDASGTIHGNYKAGVTPEQIQIAMSIPGPLMGKGDPVAATSSPAVAKQADIASREPQVSVA